jgi:3D (Asp-Asp-Asp) domain-containing protein
MGCVGGDGARPAGKLPAVLLSSLLLCASLWLVSVDPHRETMDFTATAYALEGITKSGEPVRKGIVAADPAVIPLGAEIRITGADEYSGRYTVLDTGAKIKGRHIDIYVGNYHEATAFGVRKVEVEILNVPQDERDSS